MINEVKGSWHYGWNIVGLTMIFQAASMGIILYSFALLVLPLAEEFAVPRSEIVLVITVMQLLVACLSPVSGVIIDRIPAIKVLGVGLLSMVAGLILLSLSQKYWQVMALYCAFLSLGLLFAGSVLAQSLVARWFISRRGMAMGLSALGTAAGGFIFPLLLSALIPAIGWRYSILALAGIVFLILPLAWLVLRRKLEETDLDLERNNQHSSLADAHEQQWDTLTLLGSGHFWIFIGSVTPLSFTLVGVQMNLAAFAQDLGYSTAQGGALLSALFAGMIAGKLFFGTLTDRWDHRWIVWLIASLYILSLIGMRLPSTYPFLLGISVVFGFGSGGILPLLGAAVSYLYGIASFGTVMGVSALFYMLGSSAGPYILSKIQELTGNYSDAFLLLLLILIPAALLTYFLPTKPITNPSQQSCEINAHSLD